MFPYLRWGVVHTPYHMVTKRHVRVRVAPNQFYGEYAGGRSSSVPGGEYGGGLLSAGADGGRSGGRLFLLTTTFGLPLFSQTTRVAAARGRLGRGGCGGES